jgi:hypothetical protein
MKQKKFYLIINFILLLLILLTFQFKVEAKNIYLGSFQLKKDQNINLALTIPPKLTESNLQIYLLSNYFCRKADNYPLAVKILLKNKTGGFYLREQPIEISSQQLWKKNSLNLAIFLTSDFEPGIYSNQLIIESGTDQIEFEFEFEILAWKEITGSSFNLAIKYADTKTKELISSNQAPIIIQSNTNWQLYAFIEAEINLTPELKLTADKLAQNIVNLKSGFSSIGLEPVLVASGIKTNSLPAKQAIIYYQLKIKDFTLIKAGKHNYSLQFILR